MVVIIASNEDEAREKLFNDYTDEVLFEMLNENSSTVTIEYGECIPYVHNLADDCEYQEIARFDIDFEEIVESMGGSYVVDIFATELYDCEEKLKKINKLSE